MYKSIGQKWFTVLRIVQTDFNKAKNITNVVKYFQLNHKKDQVVIKIS